MLDDGRRGIRERREEDGDTKMGRKVGVLGIWEYPFDFSFGCLGFGF